MSDYRSIYDRSLTDPEGFWGEAARELHWHKPWDKVLEPNAKPTPRWFVGGQLNTCYNALDRHIEAGNGERPALIYDSPITGQQRSYSYRELRDNVALLAGVLKANGVGAGDRVIVYMPMIPEAVTAMLACARLGAVHSVVFGGFAANELATRIDDAKPKMILSASCGIEPNRVVQYKPLLDKAVALSSHKPSACLIKQRAQAQAELTPGRDLDWDAEVARAEPAAWVPVAAPLETLTVWGSAEDNVWAGSFDGNMLHYDGIDWKVVSPRPGQDNEVITGLWGSSDSDVWAVTDFGSVLHHNGSAWQVAQTVNTLPLEAVWGLSPSAIWIGGTGGLTRYDGTTWTVDTKLAAMTDKEVVAIWGTSEQNVWVAVTGGTILHFR